MPASTTAGAFSLFSALPVELRLTVWDYALSVPTVWSIAPKDASYFRQDQSSPARYIGPAPFVVSLASKEARRQLVHSFSTISTAGLFRCTTSEQWVDLRHTIIYLGGKEDARAALDGLIEPALSQVRAIAFRWAEFGTLAKICQRLASSCPLLETLIIERVSVDSGSAYYDDSMDSEMADRYITLLNNAGPALQDEGLDSDYFRALLLEYFRGSRPKIHMLPPQSVDEALPISR